jgi:ABC-type proline/glycine betaine transport system substrate-binding protein
MQNLMALNEQEDADPRRNAEQFLDEHPELLNAWMGRTK